MISAKSVLKNEERYGADGVSLKGKPRIQFYSKILKEQLRGKTYTSKGLYNTLFALHTPHTRKFES